MFEYTNLLKERIDLVVKKNKDSIKEVSTLIYETIKNDRMIHILGTGHSHMVGLELFIRAGGLANVNTVLDSIITTSDGAIRSSKLERLSGLADVLYEEQNINEGDIFIVISNSGRNAIPLEFALRAKKDNHPVIVLTSLEQSMKYPSRHSSGMKLYETGDIVLDNCVPPGDGLLKIGGAVTGAASSILGMTLLNTCVVEACKKAEKNNIDIPLFTSQNVDGYDNDTLYERYSDRLKHK